MSCSAKPSSFAVAATSSRAGKFLAAQVPKLVFRQKRAITAQEHAAIVEREQNAERRDFYELLWLSRASQSDGACLLAEDVNWNTRTICFTRKKLKSRFQPPQRLPEQPSSPLPPPPKPS